MTKKTKQKILGFWTRRSHEPLKMTVAVSAAAVTLLFFLAILVWVK